MIPLEKFPTLGRPCTGSRTFQPRREAHWSRPLRCIKPSHFTAASAPGPSCSSFEAGASGEWEGVTATFDSGGQPLELPYHQVPAAFRWTTLASLSPLLTEKANISKIVLLFTKTVIESLDMMRFNPLESRAEITECLPREMLLQIC